MGTSNFERSMVFILFAFAVVSSLVIIGTLMLVSAGGGISHPHGTIIEVDQGENFLLRYRLYWDESAWPGMYGISIQWANYENKPEENLTFLSARAYWDNGDNVTSTVTVSSYGVGADTVWQLTVGNDTYPNWNDDNFTVDIWMRASGVGDVPHVPIDNHPIVPQMGKAVTIAESGIVEVAGTEKPITIRISGRNVDVSILPSENSGLPGEKLQYIVTVANTGTENDNYELTVGDNENWGPVLSKNLLEIPAGENRQTILSVMVPVDALGCTHDNITVTATSKADNKIKDNDTCIAHAEIVRGVNMVILPDYQENLPGENLIYDITVKNTGNIADVYELENSDSVGWPLSLENTSLAIPPFENRTTKLTVTILDNATPCTNDNIRVIATSQENENVRAENSCIAHAQVVRGAQVLIWPPYKSGTPGATIDYTVTVKNTGNANGDYRVENGDDLGWTMVLSQDLLENIQPGENKTVTLSVTIPDDVAGCTVDNVWVAATSIEDENVKDNCENCQAHAAIVRGVNVRVWPPENSGVSGTTLTYTVTVINIGNVVDNYALTPSDNENWILNIASSITVPAFENRTTTLTVTIPDNVPSCTRDNVTVTAISRSENTVRDNASCVAHVTLPRGVSVSISPSYQEGTPGETLTYTVTVKNTGALDDNYDLRATDNAGWSLIISPDSLTVPVDENRNATLTVTIDEIASGCTRDNVIVTATSQADNRVSAENSCIAHAVGPKAEVRTVIYPAADVYAFGGYGIGYSRSQLKFDISGIPSRANIISAKLWLSRLAADNWDGEVLLNRVDDQVWGENLTAIEFDAQTLTNEEARSGKFMSHGWDYLDVTNQLKVDYGAGHEFSSYRLRWASDNGSEPSAGVDDGRFLVINSEFDELCILFNSSEYGGGDPYLEVVYVPPHAVSVSISPTYKSGTPGEELSYTVMVANMGNLDDNYVLTVGDNAVPSWGPTIFPTSLAVASGALGEATLTVTVPENVAPCTIDNITVTATSEADNAVSDNESCVAHRVKVEFGLVTLYKVSLDLKIYLGNGSKLVVKFYKYDDSYQAENVIWSGSTPAHVEENVIILHPRASERCPWGTVQRVALVLTADNTENIISTIASFVVTKGTLFERYLEIKKEFPKPGADRPALFDEFLDVKKQFNRAPE